MSTVVENKKAKRLRILEAAFGLFTDKSVYATAIDEVVKRRESQKVHSICILKISTIYLNKSSFIKRLMLFRAQQNV